MGLSNIEKKSFGYSILKNLVRFWHNIFYYRSFVILGKENIPTDKPLLFTPNHQNALMDALALIFSIKQQLVFVARSDIFKNPTIAKILYYIKILPIYRIRDGFDTIKKNKEIILKTADVINSGSGMVILPEGNHSGIRRLRPLKKGFARMAFETEEANDYNLDIHIVPVGIDYNNYQKYRGSLIVNFGKPIAVADYVDMYKENSAVAINQIKDELSKHLKPLIVNIESVDNYDLYNELRIIYRSQMAIILGVDPKDKKNTLFIDQQLIKKLAAFEEHNPKETANFQKKVLKYISLIADLRLTNSILAQKGCGITKLLLSTIGLLITLPIFLYGVANNFLAYWLPLMLSNKMKDPQFQSTFKFAISLFSFPIFYIIQSIFVILLSSNWNTMFLYLLSIPLAGVLAWIWRDIFIKTKTGWTYTVLSFQNSTKLADTLSLYDEILLIAGNILKKK